jgi:hypothetical protein
MNLEVDGETAPKAMDAGVIVAAAAVFFLVEMG